MDLVALERRLAAALAPHDLLTHPFYQAWNMGQLTRGDLRAYAAQYGHQVDALPELLASARAQSSDPLTCAALDRNLAEEQGRLAPEAGEQVAHRQLWARFAAGMGANDAEVAATPADPETTEAVVGLRALVAEGPIESLAALWTYELQTAKVSHTKHEGLVARYGVTDAGTLSFFAAHQDLDVHHAADLLSALGRACEATSDADVEKNLGRACDAVSRSAQAQWRFLDGRQARRAIASA